MTEVEVEHFEDSVLQDGLKGCIWNMQMEVRLKHNFVGILQIPADYICSACVRREREEVIVIRCEEQVSLRHICNNYYHDICAECLFTARVYREP